MRLKTIWTLPYLPMMERCRRTGDWAAMAFAAKLPKRVRYWVTLMEISRATTDSQNIPGTPLEDILKNLQGGPK